MRLAVHVTVPVESGNKMVKDPNGMKKLEEYFKMIKPETAYFYERNGERSFFLSELQRKLGHCGVVSVVRAGGIS